MPGFELPFHESERSAQEASIKETVMKFGTAWGEIDLEDGTKEQVIIAQKNERGEAEITREGRVWLDQQERKRGHERAQKRELAPEDLGTGYAADAGQQLQVGRERLDRYARLDETPEGR